MNKENVLAVADAIEGHTIPDLGFNMGEITSTSRKDYSGHNCGTVACIVGWTIAVANAADAAADLDRYWNLDRSTAQDFMGISEEVGEELFTPRAFLSRPGRYPPDQAVRTLRHLAETGEVDWSVGK